MNSEGFSILELLIVMTIGAVLASIGFSNWRDLQLRNELSNTTLALMGFLNEIKIDANLYNHNHTIHLFKEQNQKWCLAVTTELRPSSCQTKFQFEPNSQYIDITGLTTTTILLFYGRRGMAKTGTIRLKNAVGESRIIISARGRIRYCSYNTYLAGFSAC